MDQYSVISAIFFVILTLYTPCIDTSRSPIQPNKLVSYSIPEKRLLKKALGFDEDIYLNFTELTTKYRYPTEVHYVTTQDGYILGLFRMLSKCSESVQSYPVLMVHGIFDTADMWILSGTRTGLGYVLADNCYDVWAANSRGNTYSRRHVNLDPNTDPEYWNFTFEETGTFDIPALIDYILQKTGYSKLYYVGHSQGTTNYFVMGSLRPDYNDKVALSVQLGPVAWMKNLMSPFAIIAAPFYQVIKTVVEAAGFRELFPRDRIVHFIAEFMCEKTPKLCESVFTLATGHRAGTIPLKTISVAVGHLFSGSSIKNLAHYAQLVVSGNFQRYDEGKEGNLNRYGVVRPPQYNVSQISSPVLLVAAVNDALSSIKDVNTLASKLPNLVENYIVPKPYWSHHNHVWGIKAPEFVYPKILDYFEKLKIQINFNINK